MRVILLLALFGCVLLATVSANPVEIDDVVDEEENLRIAAQKEKDLDVQNDSDDEEVEEEVVEDPGSEEEDEEEQEEEENDDSQDENDEGEPQPQNEE